MKSFMALEVSGFEEEIWNSLPQFENLQKIRRILKND